MEHEGRRLPKAFGELFEAGKSAIAEAQARAAVEGDGIVLLDTVRERLDQLRAIAPELVGECSLFAASLENQLRSLVAQRVAEGLLDPQDADALLDLGSKEVRTYHFVGKLVLMLDYFDQRVLGAAEEARLRETITRQAQVLEQALEGLLGHVINEVLFDRKERLALHQLTGNLAQVRDLLAAPREPGLFKADYTVRRRQFIRRAGWLCLRQYGHVTTDTMGRLLETKQAYYLADGGVDDEDVPLDKTVNRELSTLREPALKRSEAESWETAAVIKAFFAKAQWKAWRLGDDEVHGA